MDINIKLSPEDYRETGFAALTALRQPLLDKTPAPIGQVQKLAGLRP